MKLDRRLTEGLRLPPLENGQWITNSVSQRMESINFNTSYTYEIPIRAEREGTLKIPSFSFRLDGQEVTTRALEVKVLPRAPSRQCRVPETPSQ
ncbi:MAG: BatD family protein [Lentisphaeria bacterium]|nr:MAG: BatD family protein [Lentisphaeria bacterium]